MGKYRKKNFSAYTDMVLAGVNYDITEKWNIQGYAKLMNQYKTKTHHLGYIVSTGYNIYKNLCLGVGYNFSKLNDRDLSEKDYNAHGFFFNIKFKFDEDILSSFANLKK